MRGCLSRLLFPRRERVSTFLALACAQWYFGEDRLNIRISCKLQQQQNGSCQCQPPIRSKATPTRQWKHRVSAELVPACTNNSDDHCLVVMRPADGRGNGSKNILGHVRVWKNVVWRDQAGNSGDGYIQIEFEREVEGSTPGDADQKGRPTENREPESNSQQHEDIDDNIHWIQFIRRHKWDRNGEFVPNRNFSVHRQLWQRRAEWFLDVPRCVVESHLPYYDTHGMHNRQYLRPSTQLAVVQHLSIFDKPSGILDPTRHSQYLIEFETYLVVKGVVVWRVHWEYRQTADGAQGCYTGISSEPATSILPEVAYGNNDRLWKVGYSHPIYHGDNHTVSFPAIVS